MSDMYEDWLSIEDEVLNDEKCRSVLHSYPSNVGRNIAKSLIASLCLNSGHTPTSENAGATNLPQLTTIKQVNWTMEVICFGLTLTLSEFETLKDSVNIYLEWLSVVDPVHQSTNIPLPIRQDPLPFVRKMIAHLENLFIPRTEGTSGNQLALCLNVLSNVENMAHKSSTLDRLTWESLLKFVLKVSHKILAPAFLSNGLAEQICDNLMGTFFSVWVMSCTRCFPSPALWKTARLMYATWRHHLPVVDRWKRVTYVITARLLRFMHGKGDDNGGEELTHIRISHGDARLLPEDITHEVLVQMWFRFLHLIKDPSELCNKQQMLMQRNVEEIHHNHLKLLPLIFLKSIKAISHMVDAFLGIDEESRFEVFNPHHHHHSNQQQHQQASVHGNALTPTIARKSSKVKKQSASATAQQQQQQTALPPSASSSNQQQVQQHDGNITSSSSSTTTTASTTATTLHCGAGDAMEMRRAMMRDRSRVDSLLHLFAAWLFDAAAPPSSSSLQQQPANQQQGTVGGSVQQQQQQTTDQQQQQRQRSSSQQQQQMELISNPLFELELTQASEDGGRAQAFATLCTIFASKKTGEHIDPVYLSRFYLLISGGLGGDSKQVIASIILNSVDLLRIDLPGVTCLLPQIITTLETILPDRDLVAYKWFCNVVQLRRASLHILMSVISLSLHYGDAPIEDISLSEEEANTNKVETFTSLRRRMMDVLTGALQTETDPVNTQIILGALLLTLQDSLAYEKSLAATAPSSGSSDEEPVSPKKADATLDIETSSGMFMQIILLVTHKLEGWKYDVSISLAALELLSALAKMEVKLFDMEECLRCIHYVCLYITSQCERPRQQHKRELHSMIVTSFHTLATWLSEKPQLLQDHKCLSQVVEIIELGISGSKSCHLDQDSGKTVELMKDDKILNPVSKRVREAAESLLTLMFEVVGNFPTPSSPASTCSLLREPHLLLRHNDDADDDVSMREAVGRFRYLSVNNSIVVALHEHSYRENHPPGVSMIVRTPSGRKVWSFHLTQTPRSENAKLEDNGVEDDEHGHVVRPRGVSRRHRSGSSNADDVSGSTEVTTSKRVFPEEIEEIPLVRADCSIPLLKHVPDAQQTAHIEQLNVLIDHHRKYEQHITRSVRETGDAMRECVAPSGVESYQAARMLLSNFNFLSLDNITNNKNEPGHQPFSVMLDEKNAQFVDDLMELDEISTRVHDTCFLFVVKQGQTTKQQILSNTRRECCKDEVLIEFLLSLGWIVDVNTHCGWSGRQHNSSNNNRRQQHNNHQEEAEVDLYSEGVGLLDGSKWALYHGDAQTELAFIFPTSPSHLDDVTPHGSTTTTVSDDAAVDDVIASGMTGDRSKLRLEFIDGATTNTNITSNQPPPPPVESPSSPTRTSKKLSSLNKPNLNWEVDSRVAIFWCHSYHAVDEVNVEELESCMQTHEDYNIHPSSRNVPSIFIHPLQNGLFMIRLKLDPHQATFALPLVSGSVVSRRSLGSAVRTTVMNICARRRLQADHHSPPHVRRKQKITDLVAKHHITSNPADFYTRMFDPTYNHHHQQQQQATSCPA